MRKFEQESKEHGIMYALIAKQVAKDTPTASIPQEVEPLLKKFPDLDLDEPPKELPPLQGIYHVIDLVPGASLPNLPAYWIIHVEKDRSWRMRMDNHAINKIIVKYRFPNSHSR